MLALSASDTIVVRGVTVRKGPAREACFTVVQENADLHGQAGESYEHGKDMSAAMRRHRLHTHMHGELQSIEIAAQSLVDFPEVAWELRMELARQCWDESRHVRLLDRRLKELGGRKGEFPVMPFEWNITCMQDTLAARLAVQNRTFEGGEMDVLKVHSQMWRDEGDEATAELLEGILSDEVQHVRFANRWLKRLAKEDPGILLSVLKGLGFMKKVIAAFGPMPGETNVAGANVADTMHASPTNIDDRRLAEFTEKEIADLLRRDGFGAIVP
jgi:hypothetical protein